MPTAATTTSLVDPLADLVAQLDLMIRARYPLIYIVTAEEEPVEAVLAQVAAQSHPPRKLYWWDRVRGWADNQTHRGSVMGALDRIDKADPHVPALFVLRDLHPELRTPTSDKSAPVVRELRNLARELKQSRHTIVLTGYKLELPPELAEEITVVDLPLPT
ncbi:MAG: AAA family ATPase, partial [Cyanobacteriota bacterium SKYGB_h_bin112]|nr:AAA family ATPase [Cyanobacteriota bacterium SKYGB_h_bin112]